MKCLGIGAAGLEIATIASTAKCNRFQAVSCIKVFQSHYER